MDKRELRKIIIEGRERLPEAEVRAAGEAIAEALLSSDFYREAQSLFVYISVGREPDTAPVILKALANGKTVCVPRTAPDRNMDAVPLKNAEDLRKAQTDWPRFYGIPEPPPEMPACAPAELAALSLVIVPSLAVDMQGYRLGYGGGYYDRFISRFPETKKDRPLFAAIQYAAFLKNVPLPRDPHDRPVDAIITEAGIIIPSSS